MKKIRGKHIGLRLLEERDFNFLCKIENDEQYWEVSNTTNPFATGVLKAYLAKAKQDIKDVNQLRLVIVTKDDDPVGFIDLFDYDPNHRRAGVGILVEKERQGNGYATEALFLLIEYAFSQLKLHQLYANITPDNKTSIKLFKKYKFEQVGTKKDWLITNEGYKNEILFQLINEKS